MADTTFTGQIATSLQPWNDPQGNWQALNAALAAPVEQVYGIVADQGSPDDPAHFRAGWSALLDPDNCPAAFIPFGAQFVGVQIPPNTPEAEARAIWKAESGFKRGTPAAMISAAQRFLAGAQTVFLLERTPNPYSVTMVMRPGQVIDRTSLENAVLAVKPVGIVVTFIYTDAFIWNQAIHTWSADVFSWNAASSTQP